MPPLARIRQVGDQPGLAWDIGTGVAGYAWHTGTTPRATVLFQHGYGDYTERWITGASGLFTRLVENDIDVYGFDMWAHGRSPGKRGVTGIPASVSDHIAAREALREDASPVFLVAHSLGGLVTLSSALRDPRHIAGIILISPALDYHLSPLLVAGAQLGGFLMPTLPGLIPAGKVERLTHQAHAVDALKNDPLMYTGHISWLTAAGGAVTSERNWSKYHQITAPILAIYGTDDGNTDPEGSSRLIRTVSSVDAEFHPVPGGWHSLLDDTAGSDVLAHLIEWMRSRT